VKEISNVPIATTPVAPAPPASTLTTPNPAYAFATMRNSHEAIRKALIALVSLEGSPDYPLESFTSMWKSYRRAINVHAVSS
jgi:hypothetical protein